MSGGPDRKVPGPGMARLYGAQAPVPEVGCGDAAGPKALGGSRSGSAEEIRVCTPGRSRGHTRALGPNGTGGIREALARLAALHAELARTYEDLAEDAEIGLADRGKASLTQCSPMSTPLHTPRPGNAATDPRLISQKDLAKLLQCHSRTVRRMELEGELPQASGEGRLKRWRRADIEKWIAGEPVPRRRGSK